MSEELLHIYVALRRLKCLNAIATEGVNEQLFPKTFLLKQLNERLEDLDISAIEICTDLFKQVNGQTKRNGTNARGNHSAIDPGNDAIRYPEFDEYFHFCVHKLYNFIISLCWHEIDIEELSETDFDYVTKHLKFVDRLLTFRDAIINLIKKDEAGMSPLVKVSKTPSPTKQKELKDAGQKKSNIRGTQDRKDSPRAQRRVRFKDLAPANSGVSTEDERSQMERRDVKDNQSVFALDLLIYATNIYVQRLVDHLFVWSANVQTDLDQMIDSIFDAKTKIRARQLQVIAKKIKVYNDVHLTVLDHLNEIKRTYLIRNISGALLSLDSRKLLINYKIPRIRVYIQRIGLDIEVKILERLAKQCLQIFFNLVICEMNSNPMESPGSKTNKSQENVMNFVLNWLKVDHILFGESKPKGSPMPQIVAENKQAEQIENISNQFKRPQLVAKTSTLSFSDKYKSSSRILSQADNLSEFMREFIDMISGRLRYEQQLKYFLEVVSTGLTQVFQVIAPQLEQQLQVAESNGATAKPAGSPGLSLKVDATKFQRDGNKQVATLTNTNLTVDLLAVKLRCLKFIHVISQADKIVANEAASRSIDMNCDLDLDLKLAKLTQVCMDAK